MEASIWLWPHFPIAADGNGDVSKFAYLNRRNFDQRFVSHDARSEFERAGACDSGLTQRRQNVIAPIAA
jgi:hypothetical protein